MKSLLILIALLISSLENSYSQFNEPIQNPQLNNLVLSEEDTTVSLGMLGNVKKIGTGEQTMILIPGWGFGGDIYENFTHEYENTHTIYVVTLAGFDGTSPPPIPEKGDYDKQLWINGGTTGILNLIKSENLVKCKRRT